MTILHTYPVRLGIALFWLPLLMVTSVAQTEQTPLNFIYGYQAYAYSDSTSLFELDYQFSERGLVYLDKGNQKIGTLYLRLVLTDENGKKALATDWITTNPRPSDQQEPRDLLGIKYFELRPGKYSAKFSYEVAGDPTRRDSASFPLSVRSFAGTRLAVSDIEVVSEDVNPTDDASNPFYKSGWVIYPNPVAHIVPPFLLLTTYLEIYNANRSASTSFDISYSLADTMGRIFYQQDKQLKRPAGTVMHDLNRIDLSELPSGSYYLLVKAMNGLSMVASDSAVVIKPILVSNPEKDAALAAARTPATNVGAIDVVDPIYAGKNETELAEEFQKIKYIARNDEVDVWKNLKGEEAMGRFLTLFWSRRDPSPGTIVNEFRDDYFARVEQASNKYRAPMARRGWDSDRGRVLLQYGEPASIDRHPSDYNRKPYEIWTYVRENMVFVFVDRSQTGTYALVHSNAPHEPRDENWVRNFAMLDRQFDR